MWMVSLALLIQVVPVSLAGLGLREETYAYLFTLFNLPAEKGILIGLLFFSQLLLFSIFGGLLEFTEKE
jgi:hypothetical protein